jgi:uncharacterized SAM-binding protein YcdF (DUF218 family)
MFFVLSKTVGALVTPSIFIATLGLSGLILLCSRFASLGRKLVTTSMLLFVVCGLSPVGLWMLIPLEDRFPRWEESRGKPTGIIVLGGSIAAELSAARGMAVFPSGADRLVAAAELARRYPDIPVIFTGGSSTLSQGDAREADFASDVFQRLGLAKDRVILERDSRNTVENAAFTKVLAAPKPGDQWLLVTSAYHMARSVGLFRHVGFSVQPYPVDWQTAGSSDWFGFDRPLLGMSRTDTAVREWIALFVNWFMGNSSEIFPSRSPAASPR